MRRVFFLLLGLFLSVSVAWADNVSVLTTSDADLYRRIFTAQGKEDWKTADASIAKLEDKSLMGHVLAERYFSKTYKTKPSEIESWFKKYADLPEAPKMYQLAKTKKAQLPSERPVGIYGNRSGACLPVYRPEPIDMIEGLSFSYLPAGQQKKARATMRQISRYIRAGRTLNARQVIDGPDAKILFGARDHDAARMALAFSYFLDGRDDRVIEVIVPAVKRSGDDLPLGHWTLGLSYWRQGKIKDAAYHFDKVAYHSKSYPLLKSAGAFWASRANLKLGNFAVVNAYLEIAAQNPRTFYGILATHALGRDLNLAWAKPVLPEDEVTESFSHPTFERVLALKQINQDGLARQELSQLFLHSDDNTKALLSLIASRNGIDDDLIQITGKTNNEEGRYPAPNWVPESGWRVDRALVFAFVKQESCFNANAQSSVGAMGLMQIMPENGRMLANICRLPWNKRRLSEPEYNLALGQQYILFLMKDRNIENNLIFTAVAYNSGPGSLNKMKSTMKYNDDPLLFVESIKFKETRGFVERIMANHWIYRTLMNQPLYSLDHLIEGKWPTYVSSDEALTL